MDAIGAYKIKLPIPENLVATSTATPEPNENPHNIT